MVIQCAPPTEDNLDSKTHHQSSADYDQHGRTKKGDKKIEGVLHPVGPSEHLDSQEEETCAE
jgi:hypothetical protein